ncbi:thymidine phosphorylase [Colwelliaceae bacterium BS250]
MIPQEIIRCKSLGQALSNDQVQEFVTGLVTGEFNDAQVGAMAMAVFQQGMNTSETVALTQGMRDSGLVLNWSELDGPIVDKHSTGGVGDKVSFMLAAIVAANGAFVPMIAGRGLGHTGGTVDKLESITGFNVQPSIDKFKHVVKNVGMAIIAQTSDLAPADKRLYGIRDITATVNSIPLITASILSKKLAAGLDSLVMDVKVGNGAVMQDLNHARELAQSIVNVANGAGVKTQAIITDMNQVLGTSAGNAIEIIEVLDYLTGTHREQRLHQVVCALAQAMLVNAKIADSEQHAQQLITQCLDNGQAAEVFAKMIHALGGPSNLFDKPWQYMPQATVIKDIVVTANGFIGAMQTRDIGMTVVSLGGGRIDNDQAVNHSVGFDQILPVGTKVQAGDIIARVHADTESTADLGKRQYLQAVVITAEQAAEQQVIYETVC